MALTALSKMTLEVARRGQRAALEPSKATKEALGGSRTAFWRPKGDGVCGICGGRRDVRGPSELNLDEVLPAFHTLRTPVKQGAADLIAPRIPPSFDCFTTLDDAQREKYIYIYIYINERKFHQRDPN